MSMPDRVIPKLCVEAKVKAKVKVLRVELFVLVCEVVQGLPSLSWSSVVWDWACVRISPFFD